MLIRESYQILRPNLRNTGSHWLGNIVVSGISAYTCIMAQ